MSALAAWPVVLWYARQVVADVREHDDATVITACHVVEANSEDADEIVQARELRTFIQDCPANEVTP